MAWGLMDFEGVKAPLDSQVIWRYLSFFNFVELVHMEKLWFHRADKFKDPLEGTFTEKELAERLATGGHSNLEKLSMLMRQFSFVSCWREGAAESMAMWELYNRGEGTVAIKSTAGRLKDVLRSRPETSCVGSVEYVNRSTHAEREVGQNIVFRKDLSYSFENEVRAVILDPGEWGYQRGLIMAGESGAERVEDDIRRLYERAQSLTPAELDSPEFTRLMNEFFASNARNDGMNSGIEIKVDLPRLITEVVVGPEVEPMQSRSRALVESVAKNLGCKITSSTLLVKPY
jgi:hypothetical protein